MRHRSEKPESCERCPEQFERDSSDERSDWRIGDISPRKMTRVVQGREFVAMEAVLAVRECMQKDLREREDKENKNGGA